MNNEDYIGIKTWADGAQFPIWNGSVLPPAGYEDPIGNCPGGIYQTAMEINEHTKAPPGLILSSILACAALSTQGVADVVKPLGGRCPLSLAILVVAHSGERKTGVNNLTFKAIWDFQKECFERYRDECKAHESKVILFEEKVKEKIKKYRKLVKDGKNTEDIEKEIRDLKSGEPVAPRKPIFLYEQTTFEGLVEGLSKNLPSAGVVSSEGKNITDSTAFKKPGLQNSLWSGDTVTTTTKSEGQTILDGVRLTTQVMIQPDVFNNFVEVHGNNLRGSGMLARFLVAVPSSTQGFRQSWEEFSNWCAYEGFCSRVDFLMRETMRRFEAGENKKSDITFSPEAADYWKMIHNEIESNLAFGGRFELAPEHGGRISENIARLAAIFSFFENGSTEVRIPEVMSALHIVFAYSNDFMSNMVGTPQYIKDGDTVWAWLRTKVFARGYRFVRKRYLLQYGPNCLRKDQNRLHDALNYLSFNCYLRWASNDNPEWLDLTPGFFEPGRFEQENVNNPLGKKS